MKSRVRMRVGAAAGAVALLMAAGQSLAQQSAARYWDEQLLAAIRLDRPRPPVHARNLYHTSIAMYDAWAAYDAHADQVIHHERATAADVEAARAETISYAAYRLIRHRFQNSISADAILPALDAAFVARGYDINNTSTVGNTPAALGNRIFQDIRDSRLTDGSNEGGNYAPNNGYMPVNAPLIVALQGITMADPNRWQPLALAYLVKQNGIIIGAAIQSFVCPHWNNVTPFALVRTGPPELPYLFPGPQPMLGTATDAQFKDAMMDVLRKSSYLTPADGVTIDIGLNHFHNSPLGTNDGTGYPVNPVTGQPYESNVVLRGDYARILAEFWADGPDSETPPGHWNVVANDVSDTPGYQHRIFGEGPVVPRLEWDVKMYLAINGAVHDAAVACWGAKGIYDSVRPICAIRYMCSLGQSSDPNGPSYNPNGIPLEDNLTAVITAADVQPGGRFEHLVERDMDGNITNDHVGDIAVRAWLGQPDDPSMEIGGVGWILGEIWFPYQASTFVTPPFAGYYSGHSTFSRSAAEVMAKYTGSPYFPGGIGGYTFQQNQYLEFELGPTQTMTIEWATYFDAADEAGISRLWGGIHPYFDDFTGRINGHTIGLRAAELAKRYYQGRVSCPANWNGDDFVNSQDFFDFLTDFFALEADFNRDGFVNSQDFFDFITALFNGCP
ncbi:MAG: vanadium-dependent haloperoxidase [Phycisphaerales bacterium]